MEVSTIIGIVIAIIICIVGLRMILRKPNDAAPSLDSALHINEETQKPVIPRHVRHELQTEDVQSNTTERVEPSLATIEPETKESTSVEKTETVLKADEIVETPPLETATEQTQSETDPVIVKTSNESEADESSATEEKPVEVAKKVEPEFSLNPNVEVAAIKDFEDESSILDVHLHEQRRSDDESTLANAETIIALNVYPNPRKALSGDKTLKVLLKYGLRFGEMNCFHRYEDPENDSPLMFSVLRITNEGPAGFDLEALSVEQVQGLAFFLALPHQNVQKGYDSMVSIAGLIARETDGTVYDENNLEFTPQLKEHWRHKAIDYRSGQAV